MVKITNIKHSLYMPPLKKYEVYGKFPWKLIIQVLLVLFTTMQTTLVVRQTASYSYSQYTMWNNLFLNKDVSGSDTTITNTFNIFGEKSLASYIQLTVDKYFNVNLYTISEYTYRFESNGLKTPPKLYATYFDNKKALELGLSIEYNLHTNDLGPITSSYYRTFLSQVKEFEIRFTLIHNLDSNVELASSCYEWEIKQKYIYSSHGAVTVELWPERKSCESTECN